MSRRINELRRNNTSGVPGLRLNRRHGYLVIDVSWRRADQRKCGTSYLVDKAPLAGVERALVRREIETGVTCPLTARQAWARLSRALP